MACTDVTVNVSGKFEINLEFAVTFSVTPASEELRSILNPILRPANLALTEISEPRTAQLGLLARPSSNLSSCLSTPPPTPAPSLGLPSLSMLDTDWLPSPSESSVANVFGPEVVESITNAFNGILAELNLLENDDDAEGNVEFNGGEGSNGDAVADVVEGNDEYDDDVVFLCEIVKS